MKLSILVSIYVVVCPSTVDGRFDDLNKLVKRWKPEEYTEEHAPIVENRNGPLVNLDVLFYRDNSDDVVTEENYMVKVPQLHQYLSALYVFSFERIVATMLSFYYFVFENDWFQNPPRSKQTFLDNLYNCHRVFRRMYNTLNFFDQFMHGQVTFLGDRLINDLQRALLGMINVSRRVHQTDDCYRTELIAAHMMVTTFYDNNMIPVQDYMYDAANNSLAMAYADNFLNEINPLDSKLNTITDIVDESLANIEAMCLDLGFEFDERSHRISIAPLPEENGLSPPPLSDEDDE